MVFGFYPALSQLAYSNGANASFLIIATSFARALSLIGFCLLTGKKFLPRGKEWSVAISGGFFQAVSIFGILSSLQFLPGSVTMVIVFTSTLMLLFWLIYKKEVLFDKFTAICTLTALFGISLVVDVWHAQSAKIQWVGILLASIAALATASRIYVFGKQLENMEPAVVGAQIFSFAAIYPTCTAFYSAPLPPSNMLGYVAVGSSCLSLVIGTFAMFYGIAALGSFQYSLMAKLEPVFTALVSFVVLNEVLNVYQYTSILIVILSLMANQLYEDRKLARTAIE